MARDTNRIEASGDHIFSGHQIDRSQPLSFRLNGQEIHGYKGDTILSAALASGISSVGTHRGEPLALGGNLGLAVRHADGKEAQSTALPIERTPAIDGLHLETIGMRSRGGVRTLLSSLVRRQSGSLDVELDTELPIPTLFDDASQSDPTEVDIAVIGGGIAGLSAADAAAKSNQKVALLEKRGYLGGEAVLFGNVAGEQTSESLVDQLNASASGHDRVEIFLFTEVQSISKNRVVAHQVSLVDGVPVSRRIVITARTIILASGCSDNLPIFQGNRLPGVSGISDAFHLAWGYGVWPKAGDNIIAACDNSGFRLSLLADQAGIKVNKYLDSRIDPQSRFAEFAKASGIRSESGVQIAFARGQNAQDNLTVGVELSWEGGAEKLSSVLDAEGLIASGGWQAQLELWHTAGGHLALDTTGTIGALPGRTKIRLAGSCAGYLSNKAVVASGAQSIDDKAHKKPVDDPLIDPVFETPQGVMPISRFLDRPNRPPAYFSPGWSLLASPRQQKQKLFQSAPVEHRQGHWHATERALTLSDIRGMIATRGISLDAFDAIVHERCVTPIQFAKSATTRITPAEDKNEKPEIPAYLEGRFDTEARLWRITGGNAEASATGDLLFANSDIANPADALGVVISGGVGGYAYAVKEVGDVQLVARGAAGSCTVMLSEV